MKWKKSFVEHYSKLTDMDEFVKYSEMPLRKSIRINTLKASSKDVSQDLKFKKIPWCSEGYWVKSDLISVGNTLEHFLGKIYLQEAASMIPPVVLDAKKDERVLDLCAAPGSKTTQISAMMENTGLLVANDVAIDRLKPLRMNTQRCGCSNVVISQMKNFSSNILFDRVLVDAPCSGTGTIRKSPKTVEWWNPNFTKKMVSIQKKLIIKGFDLLKKNGVLVYSTCTLEPEENEGVIDYLLSECSNADIKKIELNIKRSSPILSFGGIDYDNSLRDVLRIWPQDNDTEGFFVAKIIKR